MRSNKRQRSSANGTTFSLVTGDGTNPRFPAIPVLSVQLPSRSRSGNSEPPRHRCSSQLADKLVGSSRCGISLFLALTMVNLKTSARLVGEIGPLACQYSFVLIVGEKLHPFRAVTYHITGHIRVQGFYVSGMNISTYEAPGETVL